MILAARTITLKDGRLCVLRSPLPSDAENIIRYLKTSAEETPFLNRYADEYTMTKDDAVRLIERLLAAPRDLLLLAEVEGELAGASSFFSCSNKSRCSHRCTVGIVILKKFWDRASAPP